jgi:elongation factor 1-alpha
MECIFK